jgi:ferredoxin-NADP reductase/uncharacterized iron-regulated membrane protein
MSSTTQSSKIPPPSAGGRSAFRRTVLWLHTWVGLTVGLALLFLAVTGGVLVMRPHFEDFLNRRLVDTPACANPLPLDTLAATARLAHPGDKLDKIELTPDASRSVGLLFSNKDYVYVDRCTGRVLGQQNQYGGLFGVIDGLHRFRFVDNGRKIAGVLNAMALVFILAGGLFLWWPRNRKLVRAAFTFNWKRPGMARTLNLHRFVGIYAVALLLALVITGVPLSFDWAKALIADVAGSSTENPPPPLADHPIKDKAAGSRPRAMKMEDLWQRIRADAPTMTWAGISYPKKGVVAVEYLERGAIHADAKSHLYLDAVSGRTLAILPYATGTPLGRKIYLFIIALHSGLFGGLPLQLALMLTCLSVPVQVYSGFSPYIRKQFRKAAAPSDEPGISLQVAAKRAEAQNIVSFELCDPKGGRLPAFSAGSHIDLHIAPGLVRQYSLCNDPADPDRYVIAVLREDDSRGGSTAMHNDIEIGDLLTASLPKNHFPLAHEAQFSVLIAGGIGITPIVCMAERLANTGAEFSLHYSVRALSEAAFIERISTSTFATRTTVYESAAKGRLNVGQILKDQPDGAHVYVCGPASLIDDVIAAAAELGWPDSRVHREYFVAEQHDTSQDVGFEVKIASTGEVIAVPKDSTVIEALASHGIHIPMSCSEGVCGTCLTRVLEGEVQHRDRVLSAGERVRNTQFTPCCSRAATQTLVLDL